MSNVAQLAITAMPLAIAAVAIYFGAREVKLLRKETGDRSWLTAILSGEVLRHRH
jgi:hypothetical protein